jgi:hypothetical protein
MQALHLQLQQACESGGQRVKPNRVDSGVGYLQLA